MRKLCCLSLLALLFLASCAQLPQLLPTPEPSPWPTTVVTTADIPDAKQVVQRYLEAWKSEDYAAMYALLTSLSHDALSQGEFTQHYTSVMVEAALESVDYEIMSVLVNPDTAQVSFQIVLNSSVKIKWNHVSPVCISISINKSFV